MKKSNGYRIIGQRGAKLIYGPMRKQLVRLANQGIDGFVYLRERYNVSSYDDFRKINTKNLSGIISDLASLGGR